MSKGLFLGREGGRGYNCIFRALRSFMAFMILRAFRSKNASWLCQGVGTAWWVGC
jgi:hypothetical protein